MGLGFSTPGLRIPIGVCDSASGVEWSWSRVTESWKSGTRSNKALPLKLCVKRSIKGAEGFSSFSVFCWRSVAKLAGRLDI